MRGLTWTVIISFLLILGIGIFSGRYSHFISDEMRGQLRPMGRHIQGEQWDEAARMAEEMEKTWQKRGDILSMRVNHGDVDEVSAGLLRLRASLEARDEFHSLLYAAELSGAVSRVYHRNSLQLKNIL